MQRTILQIPVSKDLKNSAEKAALNQGFSSLQEIIRIFMKKLAAKKISVTFEQETVFLSQKNEKRYLEMEEDFKKDKNFYKAKDVDEFLKQLNAD